MTNTFHKLKAIAFLTAFVFVTLIQANIVQQCEKMDNVNLKKFQIKECSVELEQMDPKLMEKYVKATNVKGKLIFVQKMCKILEFFGKT